MKNLSVLGFLMMAAFSAGLTNNALACNDEDCTDKSGVFLDAINFSRGLSQCPTFTDAQALQIASAVVSNQISYRGFKKAYQASCSYADSFRVANTQGEGDIFADLINFSRGLPNCPTLIDQQAAQTAAAAVTGEIHLQDFKSAYQTSCSFDDSMKVAHGDNDTAMFIDLLQFSRNLSGCPTLTDQQSLRVIQEVDYHEIDYNSFKLVYQTTCSLDDSIAAASSPQKAQTVVELINFTRGLSTCPTLNDSQALDVAQLVVNRSNNLGDFKNDYQATCDLTASIEASRCLNH